MAAGLSRSASYVHLSTNIRGNSPSSVRFRRSGNNRASKRYVYLRETTSVAKRGRSSIETGRSRLSSMKANRPNKEVFPQLRTSYLAFTDLEAQRINPTFTREQ